MNRRQNVIIFSAGESVRNGNVEHIKEQLSKKDILCYDYRSLFERVHDSSKIALLPVLTKKIPTFDFALIIADCVDKVRLRGEEMSSMRDNVIFEIGLCVMALGVERVILLADSNVRIPEDLEGVGRLGIECITFDSSEMDGAIDKVGGIIDSRSDILTKRFASQIDDIINHINVNADLISPVFIGAAVSSAEAYFLNFIVRLFENTDKCFSLKDYSDKKYAFPEKINVKIIIPTTISSLSRDGISDFYKTNGYSEYVICDAGVRGLFFHGKYDGQNGTLTVVDIPTSITASYTVVQSVLSMDSDDDYDSAAEERFAAKEMDIYAFALSKLLLYDVAFERLGFIRDRSKKEMVLKRLRDVSVQMENINF